MKKLHIFILNIFLWVSFFGVFAQETTSPSPETPPKTEEQASQNQSVNSPLDQVQPISDQAQPAPDQVQPPSTSQSDVKTEVPTGSDYISRKEDEVVVSDQNLINMINDFDKEIKTAYEKIDSIVNAAKSKREESYTKFRQADAKLSDFFREVSELQGNIQEKINEKISNTLNVAQDISNYKKEIDQLKAEIDTVDLNEDKVLESLKKFDGKIDSLIDIALNIKKLNADVLSSTDQSQINNSKPKLQDYIKQADDVKKFVDDDFEKDFNSNLNLIESGMQKVKDLLKDLTEKGKKLGLNFEADVKDVKKEQDLKTTPTLNEKIETESVFYKKTVNFFASIVNFFKSFFKSSSEQVEKKTELTTTSSLEKVTKEDLKPTLSPEKIKKDPILEKIEKEIKEVNLSLDKIGEQKKMIETKRQNLEKLELERVAQLQKKTNLLTEMELEQKDPAWKKTAKSLFNDFLDVTASVALTIKNWTLKIYEPYIKKPVVNFFQSVNVRSKQLEKQEELKKDETIESK